MANPLFSQEVNYSDLHHSDLPYSTANPIFSPEQMIDLQDIISQAVASAIEATLASQKELALNIPFFYPDMPHDFISEDDHYY